jgi:hypothetical protein
LHDTRADRSWLSRRTLRSLFGQRRTLLAGIPLRGRVVTPQRLWRLGIPIGVLPADPPDPWHTREAAETVAAALHGAHLLLGTPVTPSPHFSAYRARFARIAIDWLEQVED